MSRLPFDRSCDQMLMTCIFARFDRYLIVACLFILSGAVHLPMVASEIRRPKGECFSAGRDPQNDIHFVPTKNPLDRGTPRAVHGTGSSRGGFYANVRNCFRSENYPPIEPLTGSEGLNLTLNPHPSIWVYIPFPAEEIQNAELSLYLQHEADIIYRARLQLPSSPGVFRLQLPNKAPSLEVGQAYDWYLIVHCPGPMDEEPDAGSIISIAGIVKRISPSQELMRNLEEAKEPLERVSVFARHHLWYDALTELGELLLTCSTDPTLSNLWIRFLSDPSVGLGKVAREPLIGELTMTSQPINED